MTVAPFQRALVVRGGALGDFLLTLPVLHALRSSAPDSRLEVLAYPGIASLARTSGLVDQVRSIEYGPLAGFFTRGATLDPELQKYFGSFDLVVSYLYDPDGIFAENLRASGVKRLVEGPPRVTGTSHAIDQLAAPLSALGLRGQATGVIPTISLAEISRLQSRMAELEKQCRGQAALLAKSGPLVAQNQHRPGQPQPPTSAAAKQAVHTMLCRLQPGTLRRALGDLGLGGPPHELAHLSTAVLAARLAAAVRIGEGA